MEINRVRLLSLTYIYILVFLWQFLVIWPIYHITQNPALDPFRTVMWIYSRHTQKIL